MPNFSRVFAKFPTPCALGVQCTRKPPPLLYIAHTQTKHNNNDAHSQRSQTLSTNGSQRQFHCRIRKCTDIRQFSPRRRYNDDDVKSGRRRLTSDCRQMARYIVNICPSHSQYAHTFEEKFFIRCGE